VIEDRLVSPTGGPEDESGNNLRPTRLGTFVGQETLKERLQIAVDAARERGEFLEHVLFHGPPGLGKTTLAHIIAAEMHGKLVTTSGPALEKTADLMGILTNLEPGDVLFVDEIHRTPRAIEEYLYPAMEDFAVDFVLDKGPFAKAIRLALKRFTLVGATTRAGLISSPLRDRFGLYFHLDFYDPEALAAIVARSADILGVPIAPEATDEIARRARGTPRIANRLLRRVRDFAEVRGNGVVTQTAARDGLKLFGVDEQGLDKVDRAILDAVCRRFGGGPVGLSTLAISVGEEPETVEDVYEPFLLQLGMLKRTARGRVATPAAWDHLGMTAPATAPAPPPLFD
jgi:holliday junction DNA helicase RuvB